TLGPPQTVTTHHPLVAVHTRLTDEVEPWKIKRTLVMAREMGATTIVEFFPWAYYQGADGNIAWERPDLIINHAHTQGLTVIARLGMVPGWARPPETPLNYLPPDAYDDFAAYAAAFANRYQDKVDFIIVGNEPNLSFEWGYLPTTATDYVELLRLTHTAVKEAAPHMGILAGALAPTLEPLGSQWGTNDLIYLEAMYQAGAAPYFDALAVHTYGFTFPADTPPAPDLLNFRRVELLRDIMINHGDDHKKIYITESGWNDHPRWTRAVRPSQRIQYTLDAFAYAEANWPYVESITLWVFRTPAPTRSYTDYFTLVTPEFIPKPIYNALQTYTQTPPE
ncbi:MAG TPA: hypothetical protein VLL52_02650, partial [Anaerolineae bacterium]|nr:hypothetical protein [Anaerolineae bacterium]